MNVVLRPLWTTKYRNSSSEPQIIVHKSIQIFAFGRLILDAKLNRLFVVTAGLKHPYKLHLIHTRLIQHLLREATIETTMEVVVEEL